MEGVFPTKLEYIFNVFKNIYDKEFLRIEKVLSRKKIDRIIIYLWKIQEPKEIKENIIKFNYYIIHKKDFNLLSYIKFEKVLPIKYKYKIISISKNEDTPILKDRNQTGSISKIKKKIFKKIVIPKEKKFKSINRSNIIKLIERLGKFIDKKKINNLDLIKYGKIKDDTFMDYFITASINEWLLTYNSYSSISLKLSQSKNDDLFLMLYSYIRKKDEAIIVYNFLRRRNEILYIMNIKEEDIIKTEEREKFIKRMRFEVYFDLTPEEKIKLNTFKTDAQKKEYIDMLVDLSYSVETKKPIIKEINDHEDFYYSPKLN
jgi:hypothetical protein